MANTFAGTVNFQLDNGSDKQTWNPPRFSNTPSTFNYHRTVWTVGTSAETMPAGDVSSERWLFLKNLDTTNYVTVGPDSGGNQINMLKLLPGDISGPIALDPAATIKATANTAACKVEMLLIDSTT